MRLAANKNNHHLQDYFIIVPAAALKTTTVPVQILSNASAPSERQLTCAKVKDNSWLHHASPFREKKDISKGDAVAWSAFHAVNQHASPDQCTTLIQLLPLFYKKAATAAMIKHGMNMIRWRTEFINPGQIPVNSIRCHTYLLWPNSLKFT